MRNFVSFTLSINFGTAFGISTTCFAVLALIIVLVALLNASVKKKRGRSLFNVIKSGTYNALDKVYDFCSNNVTKTVYSNKKKNFSGTTGLVCPPKKPDKKCTYEFLGWEKLGYNDDGSLNVKPVYLKKAAKCVVNVYNDDKTTLLASYETEFGAGVDLSNLKPEKLETRTFTYVFAGWDKDTKSIYKNENIYAVYKAIPKKYKYSFCNYDNTILLEEIAIFGSPILPPNVPKRPDENGKSYKFVGWKNYEEGMLLTKNCKFFAIYKEMPATLEQKESFNAKTNTNINQQPNAAQTKISTTSNSASAKKLSATHAKIASAPIMDYADEKRSQKKLKNASAKSASKKGSANSKTNSGKLQVSLAEAKSNSRKEAFEIATLPKEKYKSIDAKTAKKNLSAAKSKASKPSKNSTGSSAAKKSNDNSIK